MNDLFIPSVFFTLFFVVDPLGLIPVFLTLLQRYDAQRRRRVIIRAIVISALVSLFFILFGNVFLSFLGISSGAFLIAGGILLFLISMDMLFDRPSRTRISGNEASGDGMPEDISVFPLAIPLICGPGNIGALLLFSSQAKGDPVALLVISGISMAVFLITMLVMFLSIRLKSVLRETGISVITRLLGLILSALAVQFIVNGLRQIYP